MTAELHCHSHFSDGLDSPTRLVEVAAEAGLSTLALTDHDGLAGIEEAEAAAHGAGIRLIPGIELSCAHDGKDLHLLAWFVEPGHAALQDLLIELAGNREERLETIVRRLEPAGVTLDPEAIRADSGQGVIGRPHIARALVRDGHAGSVPEAFSRWLRPGRPGWAPLARPEATLAIERVRRAGGVCGVAHPGLGVSDRNIEALAAAGMDALESDHPGHRPAQRQHYRRLADRLGLVATPGSDYHGDSDRHAPLGEEAAGADILGALEARRPAPPACRPGDAAAGDPLE